MKTPPMLAILASLKAKKEPKVGSEMEDKEEGMEEEGMEDEEGLMTASDEMLMAIKDEDPKAFMDALKSFIEMC